ncbi:unnamed protein product [Ilex paraguariensis]|uniref:Protein kinase domain-containing protein n=1 Tax=Ilex paraguariensis TaxID=185542 RepID=A0ABC8T0M1_9AQUA
MVYNLLLEYGFGGTLADMIQKLGGYGLPESDVRRYTRCILRGLNHIHECGYVHCDIKLENILLVPLTRGGTSEMKAKISDFGLVKRMSRSKKRKLEPYWRVTPLYLSLEAVAYNVQEPPSDIWALGCTVLGMLMGIPRGLVEDDGIEESDEVSAVNQFSSFLLLSEADGDDEVSYCSFSNDCSFLSEEEYLSYCSKDAEGMDNQEFCSFAEETLHAEESRGIRITRSQFSGNLAKHMVEYWIILYI